MVFYVKILYFVVLSGLSRADYLKSGIKFSAVTDSSTKYVHKTYFEEWNEGKLLNTVAIPSYGQVLLKKS